MPLKRDDGLLREACLWTMTLKIMYGFVSVPFAMYQELLLLIHGISYCNSEG